MKISKYFTTSSITEGFWVALLGSGFIYLEWFGCSSRAIETLLAIAFFSLLLRADDKVWFWSGFGIGTLWFWWIGLSFIHYQLSWLLPFAILAIGLLYGTIFYLLSLITSKLHSWLGGDRLILLLLKSAAIISISYIHPFGFDWLKLELLLIHTYFGVEWWQIAILLLSITLSIYRASPLYLALLLLAYSPLQTTVSYDDNNSSIRLISTYTTVEDKWNEKLVVTHINNTLVLIDKAIADKKSTIVLPESIFPFFLNMETNVLERIEEQSKQINIVIGALYLDGEIHRNSTYIFQDGNYTIANKVVLVPFGESNPLPKWAGRWVNDIFFDGAIDYIGSSTPTDYTIDGVKYRNAICYEATSQKLYEDNPSHMIVLSNNGWFTPSSEPTLQRLLLEYYATIHHTEILHSTNMSRAYRISVGE